MFEVLVAFGALTSLALLAFLFVMLLTRSPKEKNGSPGNTARRTVLSGAFVLLVLPLFLGIGVKALMGTSYVQHVLSSILASKPEVSILRDGYKFHEKMKSSAIDVPDCVSRPHSMQVLDADDVERVKALLLERKSKWIHISHLSFALPFFTYGPYWGYHHRSIDHNHDVSSEERPTHQSHLTSIYTTYDDAVSQYRDVMLSDFDFLYDKVRSSLREYLNTTSVEYLPGDKTGVPGFHIIPSHFAWSHQLFRFHFDEVYDTIVRDVVNLNSVKIDTRTCDEESRISFTLAIDMPDDNSGLNYVDFDSKSEDVASCLGDQKGRRTPWKCYSLQRQKYVVGRMVVHSGKLPHSIGNWDGSKGVGGLMNSQRITMQGFGFRCQDKWYIYW